MENLHIEQWVFMFFLFTIVGWAYESTVESLYHRRFINRGSLKGPYIPIYGVGGCIIILVATPFRSNGFFVFLAGLIFCTVLEYFTGWLMEALFKRQFWDYSMMKFTYKNRISLLSSLTWGMMSLLMVYIIFPFMLKLCAAVPYPFMVGFDCFMMVVVSIDIIFTVKKNLDLKDLLHRLSPEQIKILLHEKRLKVGRIFGHLTAVLRRGSEEAEQAAEENETEDTEI